MSLADRQAAALEQARAHGADALLCAEADHVHWLGGVASDIETGASPFAPGPILVLTGDAPAHLVISADDAPAAPPAGIDMVSYEGFTTGPLAGDRRARAHVAAALAGRPVAVDGLAAAGLARVAGATVVAEAGAALTQARAVKDADALAGVRAAIAVADAGQARLRELSGAELTEVELFGAIRTAMESAAGGRVPVLADLVSGARTATGGGPPSDRAIQPGDLVLCDLAPRVDGWWGDSCATVVWGDDAPSTAELRDRHAHVAQALERAIDLVRPGAVAGEIDARVRAGLDFPHHTGHGIGSSYHEHPRLVPAAPTVLREGMVIALEPGSYADSVGIRLEHVVRVTADGCEDLSGHPIGLHARHPIRGVST
jgi:Xaa-Pro aminopeptidase